MLAFAPHAGRGLKRLLPGAPMFWRAAFAPHAGRGLKQSDVSNH